MALLDFLFGRTKPVPTTTTVQQTSKLPEQIAPFVEEVLGEAQQIYGQRREEGFKEFPGETIAPRTAEELAAIEGLRGLVGVQEPYRAEAEQALRATPTQFTADEAQRLMSPYQRAVTDIEKREAQRVFERDVQPALEARAIQQGGGMSGLGTRAGLQAAEAQRNQSQILADIEAKGQQRAFEQAYRQFGDETAAQRQRSQDIGQLGTQRLNIGLAEQGLAQQLGQADRAEAQALLNEQFAEFVEREQFPESSLAQYSSFVYGNPFLRQPDTARTTSGVLQPSTSMGQQLVGLGLTGLNIAGRGGAFGGGKINPTGFSLGNIFARKGGGLSSLPVINRRNGTQVIPGGGGRGAMDPRLVEALTGDPTIFKTSIVPEIQSARRAYQESEQPLIARAELRAKIQDLEERTRRDQQRQKARRDFYDDPIKGLQSLAPTASDPMSPISAGIEAVYEKPTDPEKVAPPGFIEALSKGTGAIFQAQDKQRAADKKAKADFARLQFDVEQKEMMAQQGEDIKQEELQRIANLAKETLSAKEAKEIDALIASDIGLLDKLAGIKKKTADAAAAGKKTIRDQPLSTDFKLGLEQGLKRFGFIFDKDGQLTSHKSGKLETVLEEGSKIFEQKRALETTYDRMFNEGVKKFNEAGKAIGYSDAAIIRNEATKAAIAAAEVAGKQYTAKKAVRDEIKNLSSDQAPTSSTVTGIVNALKEINNDRNLTPDERKDKTNRYISGVANRLGVKVKDIKAKLITQF
jgi:hypothetical protein